MKKLIVSLIFIFQMILLAGCSVAYGETLTPVSYAPSVTEEEKAFIDMIAELKSASISIANSEITDQGVNRRGTGVIVKKEESVLVHTYYALTTQFVVQDADTVTIYTSPLENAQATVLNRKQTYEVDEDIAVIRFQSSKDLQVINLVPFDGEIKDLESRTIFSIGTPISNSYFNYVTNPALIGGVYDQIIVHGTNLNNGQLGSPLYLKETGELIGINIYYSVTASNRPEVLINHAIFINRVIELVAEHLGV